MIATLREVMEEGGVEAVVEGVLGVQELAQPEAGGVAVVYLCRHVRGTPGPRDRETDAAAYYSVAALDSIRNQMEPWSEWLVRRVLAGKCTVIGPAGRNPLQEHGAFL